MLRFTWFGSIGNCACLACDVFAGGNYISHDWKENPVTERWTLIDESVGAHHFQQAFDTMPTWKIDTAANGGSGIGGYQFLNAPPASSRWLLNVDVNLIEADAGGGQAVRIGTGTPADGGGTRVYTLMFSTAADGDPIVSLAGSPFSMEIQGGAGKYHSYQLRVHELATRPFQSVFSVDKVQVFNGYAGEGMTFADGKSSRIEFGDLNGSPDINGNANWGNVTLTNDAIPEPSCFALVALGIAVLAGKLRLRKPQS